mmetsp:Transcript_86890/g.274318  ORF Transcript_86890/g.274318 Transcript_86890/m.274318 type:complete len:242 (-) Transcript_86890:670-1395(-)
MSAGGWVAAVEATAVPPQRVPPTRYPPSEQLRLARSHRRAWVTSGPPLNCRFPSSRRALQRRSTELHQDAPWQASPPRQPLPSRAPAPPRRPSQRSAPAPGPQWGVHDCGPESRASAQPPAPCRSWHRAPVGEQPPARCQAEGLVPVDDPAPCAADPTAGAAAAAVAAAAPRAGSPAPSSPASCPWAYADRLAKAFHRAPLHQSPQGEPSVEVRPGIHPGFDHQVTTLARTRRTDCFPTSQ